MCVHQTPETADMLNYVAQVSEQSEDGSWVWRAEKQQDSGYTL